MANKRSQVSKYPSRYGASRWVTAAQYLAELMCERRARAEKRTLPPEFWKDKHWGDLFRQQVAAANRLIKRFDPESSGTGAAAVSAFLRSERGKTCYSLMAAWVVPLIEIAHKTAVFNQQSGERKAEAEPHPECPPVVTVRTGPRPAFTTKKSAVSKLEDF